MELREDYRLNLGHKIVLFCRGGSFSIRLLKFDQDRKKFAYLTTHIPIAEADLARLGKDEMEAYDVSQEGFRIMVHTGRVLVAKVGSDTAEAFGGRLQFNDAVTKLLREAKSFAQ